MALNLDRLKKDLVAKIEALKKDSDAAYLSLGGLYPRIVAELDASLARSGAHLSRRSGGGLCAESFIETARQLALAGQGIIDDAEELFTRMNIDDGILIKELQTAIDELSLLDAHIERIKEDSLEMELVSLNALTAALKSGSAGKGFSVITEELKRLSARTILMTDRLTDSGKLLFGQFSSFRGQLELLEISRESLAEQMETRLGASFEAVEEAIKLISGDVKGLVERSAGVRTPIMAVMEGIQFGDILRQSADHVILSLEALEEGEGTGDERIDELRFLSTLADLASTLLADSAGKLGASVLSIEARTEEVFSLIASGEAERERLLGLFGVKGATFDAAMDAIRGIVGEISRYAGMKTDLLLQGEGLVAAVGQIEDKFKAFSTVVTRFRTIDIAARIEVAKQQVLRTMNDTVAAMSDLTVRIEGDVGESVRRTKALIEETRATIEATQHSYAAIEGRIHGAVAGLGENLVGIEQLKVTMRECLTGFSLYTDEFLALIQGSRGELARLRSVSRGLSEVMASLAEAKAAVEREYAARSGGQALAQAALGNDRLRAIIERFTIFTHKKAAGVLAGFDVEGGAALGEVTIF